MNKQMTLIIVVVVGLLIAGGVGYTFMNSSSSTGVEKAGEVQDETKPHTDAAPHAVDESQPHLDTSPHPVDESKPHLDASPHASATTEGTGSANRKPASVGDHADTAPHAEEQPHN